MAARFVTPRRTSPLSHRVINRTDRARHRLVTRRNGALLVVLALIASLLTSTLAPTTTPAEAAVRDPFEAGFSRQDNGAIFLTGNSQMTCAAATSGCTAARAGTGTAAALNNNNFVMSFIDADTSAATTNSTSADVALPTGSTVLYAKLVWGGRQIAGSGGVASSGALADVKFRVPNSATYETLTGARQNVTLNDANNNAPYQASIDVTDRVRAAGNGTYWVGDIKGATGGDRYAGWSLIVAYSNPGLPLRDLRVYEGFADVTTDGANSSVDIPISGFLTPLAGDVTAAIGVVAWEGDRGTAGDALKLGSTVISDASHVANNFFYSAISDSGTNIGARNPNYVNALGMDIAKVNASNVIPNGATSTTLNLTTTGDFYYPGIITTQIDLFTPSFNSVSKTVVNLNGNDPAKAGDTLEYRITLTNTGLDTASNAIVRDPLPTGVTFVPGSVRVVSNPGGGTGAKTDQSGDDQAEYEAANRVVRVRVGTGANATTGGSLTPNSTTVVTFRVTIDRGAAGSTLANSALLDYRAVTIANNYTYTGNAATSPVAALSDLALTKTSTPTAQTAGSTVTYTLTATNNGPNPAAGVSIVDTLPTGTSFVSAAPPAGFACSAGGQTVTCVTDSQAVGTSAVIPITVTVAPGAAVAVLPNTATITATTTDDVPSNNSATATTSISQSADVALTQTASPTPQVLAGNQLTYTLTAINNGPSNAAAVVITDPIPAGTTVVSATTTAGTCAVANNTLTCPVGALAPGAQAVVTLVTTVTPDTAVTSIVNTATVSSSTPDAANANNVATTTTTVGRSADLAVVTTGAPNPVVAGTAETFTIQVTNNGPSAAAGVVVTAPAVAGFAITSASSTLGSCAVTAGAINCPVGALAVGASASITVSGTVASTRVAGPLAYTGSATTSTTDPVSTNNSATASVTVTTSADLGITKVSTPTTIVAGSPVTYTMTVTNAGPSQATGALVSDPLPTNFAFVSSANGCTPSGTTVTCPVGTLAVGASAVVSFVATTPSNATGDITNTATVSATTPDPNPANNAGSALSSTAQRADLSLIKSSAPAVPQAGGQITYTLTATNNGPSAATGVSIRDDLPAGLTFVSGSTAGGGACTAAGAVVTCPVGALANGGTAVATIVAAIAPGALGTITNTAVVSSPIADPTTGNNTATSTTTVQAVADLQVTLDPVAPSYAAGTEAQYTLTVANLGPANAQGVVITGAVPPGLTPVEGSTGGACVVSGGTVTCNIGTVPAGVTLPPITLRAIVNSSTLPGNVAGSAQVGSTTADGNTANNTNDAVITVTASAALTLTKQATPNPLVAGTSGTYQLTATNNGPSDARDVVITDTLVAATTPSSASSSQGPCTITGQAVSCAVGTVPAGGTVQVLIGVNVAPGATGSIVNTASASTSTGNPPPTTATVATPVQPQADLHLTQTATPASVAAGGALTYTFTLTNSGPSDAAAVTLGNPLPAGVLVLPGGISATGNACIAAPDNASVNCDFGVVAAGTSRTVVISAGVPAGTAAGTVLTNTGTVSSPTADATPADRVATTTVDVVTVADLSVVVSPVTDPPVAGADQGFVISVANNGPSDATGVVLRNPLPAGALFVSAVPSAGSCALDGTDVVCTIGSVASGGSVTVQLTYTLPPGVAGTTLTNTATVSSITATLTDPNPANNTSSAADIIAAESNLGLTKTITSGPVVAGAPISYTLTVTNAGPSDALNVVVDDPIPVGTTLVSATAAGGTCSGTTSIRCSWTSLPVGGSLTAQLTVAVPASTPIGTVITNTATAASDSLSPTSPTATATATVTASADLATAKTFLSGNPVAGGTVRWQITVSNTGPSQALSVNLTDSAPAGVTFTATTTDAGACTINGGGTGLTCGLGALASGGLATVTVTGALASTLPGGQVLNTAAATSTTPDPNPDNNSGASTVETTTRANLSVTKSGAPSPVTAGGQATWTVVVSNSGPSQATGVQLSEPIPADVIGYSGSVNGGPSCVAGGGVLTCAVGALAPGGTATVTFTGTVNPARTNGSVGSTSTVTASTTDPDPTDNSAVALIPVVTSADLSVVFTGPGTAQAGTPVSWTASISNAGTSDAQAAVLTVNVPAAGLINPVVTGPGGVCTLSGSVATCPVGTLTPGADRATVTLTGQVDPSYVGTLNPGVVVSSPTADPVPANNQAAAVLAVNALSGLSITKTATQATMTPGQPVGWTILVNNAGPSTATNVVVTDEIPAGVSGIAGRVAPGGPDCAVAGTTLTCVVGVVLPGQPISIAVTGNLAADYDSGSVANTASLTSDTADSDPADNTVAVLTPAAGSADLRIVQALPSGAPVRGAPFDGRLLITNDGPSDAVSVVIRDVLTTDVLDAAADVLSGIGSCTVSGLNEVECLFDRIPVGQTVEIQITGVFSTTASTSLTNSATVSSATADPNQVNNFTTATVTAGDSVDLAVDLIAPPTGVAGTTITWTALVSNAGPSIATGVVFAAPAPSGVGGYTITRSDGSVCADPAFCPLADLDPGESTTVTLTATILPGYTGTDLRHAAAVSTSTPDAVSANNTDSTTTTISRTADLSVTTTADPIPLIAGGNASYTIVVTNNGPSDAPTTIATDQLPDGVTIRDPGITSSAGSCSLIGRVVNCNLGVLAPGQSVTITLPVAVAPSFGPGPLTNVATANSDVPDADQTNNTSTDTTQVAAFADLTVTKTGPTSVVAGDPFIWTVDVLNSGPSLARNVRLTDVLPVGVGEVSFRTTQGDCLLTTDAGTGRTTVDCPLGTVGVGQSARVDIIIDNVLDPSFLAGTISNTAVATSDTAEPPGSPAAPDDGRTNTFSATVTNSADISITKVPITTVGVPGQDIRWALTIQNAGPSTAAGVVLAEQLPADIQAGFYSTTAGDPILDVNGLSCTPATPCALGNLLPGSSNARVIVVGGILDPAFAGTEITNAASLTADTDGANPGNNDTTSTITVTPRAELSVAITADPATVNAGENLGWDIDVTNSGPSVARNVVLTDLLPADVTNPILTLNGAPVVCTGNLSCALGDIAPGTTVTLRLTGTLAAGFTAATLDNTVTVGSDTPDTVPADNSATATTAVGTAADLTLVKTTTASPVIAGNAVGWTIVLTANGPSVARNVVVTDILPAGLTGALLTTDVGSCADTICTLGDLAPGSQATITVAATVLPDTPAGTLVNSAAVTSDTVDPVAGGTADAPVTVVRSTDLSLVKEISPDPVVPGEPVSFLLTVANTGPSSAQSVVVTDALPDGIEDPTASAEGGTCTITNRTVECLIATLNPAASAEILISGTAAADLATGQLANTASALSSTPDVDLTNNSDSVGAPTSPADLTITQSTDVPSVLPGGQLIWTLVVTNGGPGPARGVALTDALPAGVTVTAVTTDTGSCAPIVGQTLSCALGTLPTGGSATITVTATVGLDVSGVLSNTASVNSPDDNDTTNNVSTLDTPVDPAADLAVTNAVTAGGDTAGGPVSWTVEVTNNGPTPANQVQFTDDLPAGVTAVSTDLAGCAPVGSQIICDLGTLGVGQTVTIVVSGTIAPDFRGSLSTVAAAVSVADALPATPDPLPGNNSATATSTVAGVSDLSLTKVISNSPIVAGTEISYLLTVSNAGPSVSTNTVISDPVPAGTTAVSATPSDDGNCLLGAAITCTWPAVGVSEQRTVTVVVAVPSTTADGTDITNTATVVSGSTDPTPATATVTAPVTTLADLAATKTLVGGDPVAGGELTWQIVVNNLGPSTAVAATLADTAPAGISFTSSTTTVGSCAVDSASLACDFGDLATGSSAVLSVTGTIDSAVPAGLITNTAVADSPTADPDAANNSSAVDVTTDTRADLAVTKTADADPVVAGGPVSWTVTVTNNGPSAAADVVITELIPAGVTGYTGAGCTAAAGVLSCLVGTVEAGGSRTLTFTGTVDPALPAGAIGSTTTATSGTLDPLPANNSATDLVTVGTAADLQPVITAGLPTVAGQPVSATINVTNFGPSVAQNGTLTITVPDGSLRGAVITGPGGDCPLIGGIATCALGNVAPGTVGVTITGQLNPDYLGDLTLTAVTATDTTDVNPANDTATATVTVTADADLSVTKSANSGLFTPGTAIGWTVTVVNGGPSTAVDVHITDQVPAGVLNPTAQVLPAGPACALVAGTFDCVLPTLPPGTPVQIAITGDLAADVDVASLANTVTVASTSTPDSDPADNSATATTSTVGAADLRIGKAVISGAPVAGAAVEYQIVVTNDGPSDAVQVEIADDLPAQVLTPTASVVTGTGTCILQNTSEVRCTFDRIADGETVVVSVTGTLAVTVGPDLANTATVTALTADADLTDNTTTATATTGQSADLALALAGPAAVIAGNTLSWTATITNNGPSAATGITLATAAPAGVTGFAVSVNGVPCPDPAACTLGSLAPGASITAEFSGTLSPDYAATTVELPVEVIAGTADPNTVNNAANWSTAVTRSADLAVTTSVSPDPLVAGQGAVYTVVVTNAGPSTATLADLTDSLPAGLTVAGSVVTDQGACTVSGQLVDCALGTIAPGATVTITIPVTVAANLPPGTVTNTPSVTSATPDPLPANNSGPLTTPVGTVADLTVSVNAPATVIAGQLYSWTITVDNAGPSVATGVTLAELIPAGIDVVSISSTSGSCVLGAGSIQCDLGDLAPDSQVVFTVNGVVNPSFTGGSIVHTAVAQSPTAEPAGTPPTPADGRTGSAASTVGRSADVQITKVPVTTTAVPGTDVQWQITVVNTGPSSALNVQIAEDLPAGLSDIRINRPVSLDCPSADLCTLPELLPGNENAIVYTVTGLLDPSFTGTSLTNYVRLTSDTPDPTPQTESTSTIPVTARAELAVTLTADPTTALAGGQVRWLVTVTNSGPSTAAAVVLTDLIPAGVTGAVVTIPGGTDPICTANVVCPLGDLLPGASVVLEITGTLDRGYAAPTLVNSVSVDSPTPETVTADNTASTTITVGTAADLTVTQTGPATIIAGQPISWTITVTSAGPSISRGVSLTDLLPAGVLGAVVTTDLGTCAGLVCTLGDLPPGAIVTITVTGTVDPSAPAGSITNTAVLGSATGDPNALDNTASVATEVSRSTDLAVSKTISPDPVVAGGPVTFTLDVSNTGPSSGQNVVLTDALPAGLADPVVTTIDGSCVISAGNVLTCELAELPPGGTAQVLVTGTADLPAGELANSVSVIGSTPDIDESNNSDSVGAPTAPADLVFSKTADADSVLPGSSITWTLTAANAGPGPARSVAITDTLPAGVTVTSVTTTAGTCATIVDGVLTCETGTIAAGAQVVVTVIGTVDAGSTAPLVNSASAVSPDDNTPANNVASVTTPVGAAADLVVEQQLLTTGPELVAGTTASWQVTVTNNGPADAPDGVLTLTLPAGITNIRIDGAECIVENGVARCLLGTIAVGAAVTVTLTADIDPGYRGSVTLGSAATSGVIDLSPADAVAATSTPVIAVVDLAVTKRATETQVQAGEAVVYVITATNAGPSTASGVQVLENLPAGAVVTMAVPEVGTYSSGVWAVGDLPPGTGAELKLQVILAGTGEAVNSVQIVSVEVAASPNSPIATATVLVEPVVADPGTPAGPGTPPGKTPQLPMTGFPAGTGLTWALWLLIIGCALLLVPARRREEFLRRR